MTDGQIYVLDADVFIEAARRYYAFDIAPLFWETLVSYASSGRILSIDRVEREIERGKDELKQWANDTFHRWFAPTDEDDVVDTYRRIMTWVQGQSQFSDAGKAEFAEGADGWLVAYAKTKGCVVVTEERPNPNVKKRIPLPNVCDAFGVQYIDTFAMLRTLGVRLG